MAGGAAEEESTETSSPPHKIQKLEHVQEQQQQQPPPVAYLRDADLWDLLPVPSNKRLNPDEPLLEGSAAPFLIEMMEELQKPVDPQLKEQILLREIRLFLETEGERDRAKDFHSTEQFETLPPDLKTRFHLKGWHFNASNDVGGLDYYQLLCLGNRDKVDDPITDFCNKIGNTLQSDLRFVDFCKLVFMNMLWDDTEYVGFEKAMKLKNSCDSHMKSLIIPWVLNVWTAYIIEARRYDERIELHCKLWEKIVDEKNQISEALYEPIRRELDPSIESDFNNVIKYVQKTMPLYRRKEPDDCIDDYFQMIRPPMCLDRGYPLYLKEKVTKAIQLGFIKKEDKEEFTEVDDLLKEIKDTSLYLWDKEKRSPYKSTYWWICLKLEKTVTLK